jgi:hypothetical protein
MNENEGEVISHYAFHQIYTIYRISVEDLT